MSAKHPDPCDRVEYFYYDYDENRFYDSQSELTKDKIGHYLCFTMSPPYMLIACAKKYVADKVICCKANKKFMELDL